MTTLYKVLVAVLLLLSVVNARPADFVSQANQFGPPSDHNLDDDDGYPLSNLEVAADNPQVYLIIAEVVDDDENDTEPRVSPLVGENEEVEKRSAEEVDDLETAAGTNVLRPLFVYRQQLAYRERVKKGAFRRAGIRPRF